MATAVERIRELNDQLRRNLTGGRAVMTSGIAALSPTAIAGILQSIATFDDFNHDNDPHGEHDFGAFDAEGQKIFFKIDYYDKALACGSPDPADPVVTERVLTIMLASEY